MKTVMHQASSVADMKTKLFGFGLNVSDSKQFSELPVLLRDSSDVTDSSTGAGDASAEGKKPAEIDPETEMLNVSWNTLVFFKDKELIARGMPQFTSWISQVVGDVTSIRGVSTSWHHVTFITANKEGFILTKDSQQIQKVRTQDKRKEVTECRLTDIRAGDTHTVAASDDGIAGLINAEVSPPLFTAFTPQIKVKQLSCGKEHVLLLTRTGTVYSMGIGSRGQLGHDSIENRDTPQAVEALEPLNVACVSAGGWHSGAVSDIGDVYVWGWNESGQLGLPCHNISQETIQNGDKNQEFGNVLCSPRVLDLPIVNEKEVNVTGVSCGARHSALVTEHGEVYTCGWNKYGQLGHGDTTSRDRFTQVSYFTTEHLCAVDIQCGGWTTVVRAVKRLDSPTGHITSP